MEVCRRAEHASVSTYTAWQCVQFEGHAERRRALRVEWLAALVNDVLVRARDNGAFILHVPSRFRSLSPLPPLPLSTLTATFATFLDHAPYLSSLSRP
eukprot:1628517-Rhodomonas_salina.3